MHLLKRFALPLIASTCLAMVGHAYGDQIFVANESSLGNGNSIGEYTTSGSTVNANLVGSLVHPEQLAISGSDLYVTKPDGSIDEYTTSGATVKANLITGQGTGQLAGIATSENDLFVVNTGKNAPGYIGEFNAITGATININFITGFVGPDGLALSGSDLFVTNPSLNTIGEYTTAGATVNASLITGQNYPVSIAISGQDMFILNFGQGANEGSVSEYTTSGALVNASLITGLSFPNDIAVDGPDIFITSPYGANTIGEFTTSGGTVNSNLITGLGNPYGIVVVPEPGSLCLLTLGSATLLMRRRKSA